MLCLLQSDWLLCCLTIDFKPRDVKSYSKAAPDHSYLYLKVCLQWFEKLNSTWLYQQRNIELFVTKSNSWYHWIWWTSICPLKIIFLIFHLLISYNVPRLLRVVFGCWIFANNYHSGHGHSDHVKWPWTYGHSEQPKQVFEIQQQLEWDSFNLVAHSWAGICSWEIKC